MSRAPLRYHQPLGIGGRLILAFGGALGLYGAYDLLLRHGLPLLHWGMAPFVAFGLIALTMGASFMGLAVFSGSRTVTIDRQRRICLIEFDGTFGLRWAFTHPFSTLETPRAVELSSSDGPPSWGVELPRQQGKRLIVYSYPDEARARAEVETIVAYMAGR